MPDVRLHAHRGTFDTEERIVCHTDQSWASEIEHFLDAIEQRRRPTVGNSDDALAVMRIMDRIYAGTPQGARYGRKSKTALDARGYRKNGAPAL